MSESDLGAVARILSDHEIGGEVGRGQFGVVLAARHRQLDREVAVKWLAGPVASTEEYAARFRREARILARIDHGHVVRVFDYREDGDVRLLIMEMLRGGTLADRRARAMSLESVVAATMAAASGLHHVHEQGILHRDVKPENLMFDARGVLKVTDFGLARGDVHATSVGLTQAGQFFGTPAYAAPEQVAETLATGWPPVGPASDQYALAAVCYEALTNELTHDASGGAVALATHRLNEEARPLRSLNPRVDEVVAAAVHRALARDPAGRYGSVEEFAVALGEATTAACGPGWSERADVAVRESGPIQDATRSRLDVAVGAAPGSRRRTPLIAAAAVVAALVVTAAAWLVLRDGGGTAAHDDPASGDEVPHEPSAGEPGDLTLDLVGRWSFRTGGEIQGTPAVTDDLVVVGSDDGNLYAIDRATGAEVWRAPTGGEIRSSPAVVEDRAYVGSFDGNVYAFALDDGAELWRESVGFQVVSSPAVAPDGTVVVGADAVYALAPDDGSRRWVFDDTDDVVVSSPVIAGGSVVVGSNDGSVYAIALDDGSHRWAVETGADVLASPRVVDGTVLVGSFDASVHAIDLESGDRLWTSALGSPVRASAAVDGDRAYAVGVGGRMVGLDLRAGGEVAWSRELGTRIESSPAVVGDEVVVGSNEGWVYAVDRVDGALAGAFRTGGAVLSSPTPIGDGAVVVGSNDGRLYAIEGFAGP